MLKDNIHRNQLDVADFRAEVAKEFGQLRPCPPQSRAASAARRRAAAAGSAPYSAPPSSPENDTG